MFLIIFLSLNSKPCTLVQNLKLGKGIKDKDLRKNSLFTEDKDQILDVPDMACNQLDLEIGGMVRIQLDSQDMTDLDLEIGEMGMIDHIHHQSHPCYLLHFQNASAVNVESVCRL